MAQFKEITFQDKTYRLVTLRNECTSKYYIAEDCSLISVNKSLRISTYTPKVVSGVFCLQYAISKTYNKETKQSSRCHETIGQLYGKAWLKKLKNHTHCVKIDNQYQWLTSQEYSIHRDRTTFKQKSK